MFYLIILLILTSCGKSTQMTIVGTPGKQGIGAGIQTTIIPEGDSRCSSLTGGTQYSTFIDPNNTGTFVSGDSITNVSFICNGATGSPGTSSHIDISSATASQCATGGTTLLITTNNTSTLGTICNGIAGLAAPVGAFLIEAFITPCGNNANEKENLILFSNGSLMATFSASSDADTVRLSTIPDGTFMDSDSTGCVFSLQTNLNTLTRSISWNGVTQKSWSVKATFNPQLGQ